MNDEDLYNENEGEQEEINAIGISDIPIQKFNTSILHVIRGTPKTSK